MALKTDPAILSPSTKTLLGTPVFIASRRSRGLFATMTTWSLPCRCLRCSSPSGEVYREIPNAPGRASLMSSKKLSRAAVFLFHAERVVLLACHAVPPYLISRLVSSTRAEHTPTGGLRAR